MNEITSPKTVGALTGALVTAAAWWARLDDDTQRRLRNVREDAQQALDLIRERESRGEAIRAKLPSVQDAQIGLAIATKETPSPQVIPSTAPLTRPDLSSQMETAAADMAWPPEPGVYDARGLVKQPGELTTLFLALTYEEVRAWIQGLIQAKSPSKEGKVQLLYAANALASTAANLKLSLDQYKAAWAKLFASPSDPTSDSHDQITSPPSVQATDPGIASVRPLGSPDLPGYPYPHMNTDRCSKWRITVGPGSLDANKNVASFRFGSMFLKNNTAYQPAIMVSDGRFYIANLGPDAFSLRNLVALEGNALFDIAIAVPGGSSMAMPTPPPVR